MRKSSHLGCCVCAALVVLRRFPHTGATNVSESPMNAPHTHRVQVLVAGKPISAPAIRHDPQTFQSELKAAKAIYGSVLCGCQLEPLKLVVRERTGKLFLAAWPDQAAAHALDCPFYSDSRNGAVEYGTGAIQRDGAVTHLKLHHPMRQVRARPPVDPRPSGEVSRNATGLTADIRREKLHLWGLLHYLWEEAALNRWVPGWHRDWGFTRYLLRRAAQTTMVEGKPLLQHLYIPPVWNAKKRDEIQAHWASFTAPLILNHRRTASVDSGFVIGTVRSLEPSDYGHVLKLHHHAERFYIDSTLSDMLARYSRRGWAAAKHLEAPGADAEKPYVVAAMRVEASHSGRMTVVEAALMRVSPRFIPVNSSFEDKLARVLVDEGRMFVRPLHYDNHTLALPDFILMDAHGIRDTQDKPVPEVALYVYGASIPPQQKTRIEASDRAWAAQQGMAYWQWDAAVQAGPPALPPARQSDVSIPTTVSN